MMRLSICNDSILSVQCKCIHADEALFQVRIGPLDGCAALDVS